MPPGHLLAYIGRMKDFHVHTGFCPHGSGRSTREIVLERIQAGARTLMLAEHAPLPSSFDDPVPGKDSAMCPDDLERYLAEARQLRAEFADRAEILIGFEYDWIQGYEDEIHQQIAELGPRTDGGILSVHFLNDICIDHDPRTTAKYIQQHCNGDVHEFYRQYFEQLRQGCQQDFGHRGPGILGHIDLVKKFGPGFQLPDDQVLPLIHPLLESIRRTGWSIEINAAGRTKPCAQTYPSPAIIAEARRMDIPLVFGSDTH